MIRNLAIATACGAALCLALVGCGTNGGGGGTGGGGAGGGAGGTGGTPGPTDVSVAHLAPGIPGVDIYVNPATSSKQATGTPRVSDLRYGESAGPVTLENVPGEYNVCITLSGETNCQYDEDIAVPAGADLTLAAFLNDGSGAGGSGGAGGGDPDPVRVAVLVNGQPAVSGASLVDATHGAPTVGNVNVDTLTLTGVGGAGGGPPSVDCTSLFSNLPYGETSETVSVDADSVLLGITPTTAACPAFAYRAPLVDDVTNHFVVVDEGEDSRKQANILGGVQVWRLADGTENCEAAGAGGGGGAAAPPDACPVRLEKASDDLLATGEVTVAHLAPNLPSDTNTAVDVYVNQEELSDGLGLKVATLEYGQKAGKLSLPIGLYKVTITAADSTRPILETLYPVLEGADNVVVAYRSGVAEDPLDVFVFDNNGDGLATTDARVLVGHGADDQTVIPINVFTATSETPPTIDACTDFILALELGQQTPRDGQNPADPQDVAAPAAVNLVLSDNEAATCDEALSSGLIGPLNLIAQSTYVIVAVDENTSGPLELQLWLILDGADPVELITNE